MRPKIVYDNEGRREIYPLDKDEVTIGRSPSSDIVINRQYVSRQHARIYRDGESWRVVDLGSKCGTRVNDLTHTHQPLGHGDQIYLQDFALTFLDGDSVDLLEEPIDTTRSTVSLIVAPDEAPQASKTMFQSAVDFTQLASVSPDVHRLQKLLALVTQSSEMILGAGSLDETFSKVLDLVFEHLPVQRGFVMLWDDETADLLPRAIRHDGPASRQSEIQFSRTIAEKVFKEKVTVLTTDALADDRFAAGASVIRLGIRSVMAAPIWNGDCVDGLIYADTLQQIRAFDKFDLDLLSALGNHLAIAIEQGRLQASIVEQEVVRRRLERYHSPAVVEKIASIGAGAGDALMADERDVTVLFADVVNFTERCERMEPREVAAMLNRYFSEMTDAVFRHEGTLDKFIGDCLMAVFGAPLEADNHSRLAVDAALDMREALERLNEPLPPESRLSFRVGIHSGRVVAGDIGSIRRSDYTVLGATVNIASRLEAMVARAGQVIISEDTRAALGSGYVTRPVGRHDLKGISRPVDCFEVVERAAGTDGTQPV